MSASLTQVARDLRLIADWIEQARPSLTFSPERLTTSTSVGGSTISRPAERAAMASIVNPVIVRQADSVKLISSLHKDSLELLWRLTYLGALVDGGDVSMCAERYCSASDDPGCAGYCRACWKWRERFRKRHGYDPVEVPREVIVKRHEERQLTTEQRIARARKLNPQQIRD